MRVIALYGEDWKEREFGEHLRPTDVDKAVTKSETNLYYLKEKRINDEAVSRLLSSLMKGDVVSTLFNPDVLWIFGSILASE